MSKEVDKSKDNIVDLAEFGNTISETVKRIRKKDSLVVKITQSLGDINNDAAKNDQNF